MALTQELETRQFEDAPELRDPPPLSPAEMQAYATAISKLDYKRLTQERDLLEWIFEAVSPALPEWRLEFDVYPHPLVQQRLLVLNELYKRAQENPVRIYNYRRTNSMIEWGVAGALVGGLIGGIAKDRLVLGTAVGAVLGGMAGRSKLLQTLLTDISTRAVLI